MLDIKTTNKIFKKLNINPDVVSKKEFNFGFNVEMEHRDVTHGDYAITTKIVLAHLMEYPDYYKRLKRLETAASKYWGNDSVDIFLNKI